MNGYRVKLCVRKNKIIMLFSSVAKHVPQTGKTTQEDTVLGRGESGHSVPEFMQIGPEN
jgi:hypothetical protein